MVCLIEKKKTQSNGNLLGGCSSGSRGGGRSWSWRLLRGCLMLRGRILIHWLGLVSKFEVEHDQEDQTQDTTNDDVLHVLQPELVLQLPSLLFKLGSTILQGVRSFVQLAQLCVSVKDLLDVVAHDANNLVHLGLLLGHASLGHDLLHLLGSRQGLAVWAERAAIRASLGRLVLGGHVSGGSVVRDETGWANRPGQLTLYGCL